MKQTIQTSKPTTIAKYSSGLLRQGISGDWLEGCVETPYGYVIAYSEDKMADLRFIYKGKYHYRSFSPGFGLKYKAVLFAVKKFVEEIVEGAS